MAVSVYMRLRFPVPQMRVDMRRSEYREQHTVHGGQGARHQVDPQHEVGKGDHAPDALAPFSGASAVAGHKRHSGHLPLGAVGRAYQR